VRGRWFTSTDSVAPVTNDASSEHSQSTADGASVGPLVRCSGMPDVILRMYGSESGLTTLPGAKPGSTALTRMPCSASSSAIVRLRPSRPALDAL